MPTRVLSKAAQSAIATAVDQLFDRLKARFLGPEHGKKYGLGGKQLAFSFVPNLGIGALFDASSREEGARPREEVLAGLKKIAGAYIDASREKTKARVIHKVSSFVRDAHSKGVKTDVRKVLGGHLTEIWRDASNDVKRILETETTVARNVGIMDAGTRIAAMTGNDDPVCFFVVVRDQSLCSECKRLHLMPDGITPRLWKQSEVGNGYHEKGDADPKVAGLHPHCRCVLSYLMPGFGFDAGGKVVYRKPGYDAYAEQQS